MLDDFLRLPHVIQATGLSKSEVYRQVASGKFPPPHPYRDNPNKRFWLQSEVKAWQERQLFGDLLG